MSLLAIGKTNVGLVREHNEDTFGVFPEVSLFLVADGLGGHAGGEVASRLAVETMRAAIGAQTGSSGPTASVADQLVTAYRHANRHILEVAAQQPHLSGMGTTAVALLVRGGEVAVGNLGDSRVYLFRDGALHQLTTDHSVVHEYVRQGLMSPADAERHPSRHILSRALGLDSDGRADIEERPRRVGDLFLLCSDGLTVMVSDEEIDRVLSARSTSGGGSEGLETASQDLLDLALAHGGQDNVTVDLVLTG